jgi:ubiquinone biosynthesis protein UbiJ
MLTAMASEKSSKKSSEPEGIGGLVDELASSWLVGDALTRIVDAGERAFRAQQTALSALGLPSGSQFESLTLRVRTIFHRLEELEDEIDRLTSRIAELEARLRKSGAAK